MLGLKPPYPPFLGDMTAPGHARTAFDLADWAHERSIGQLRLHKGAVSSGPMTISVGEAARQGVGSLAIVVRHQERARCSAR